MVGIMYNGGLPCVDIYLISILPKTTSKDSKLNDNMDVLSDTLFYFIVFCFGFISFAL